MNFMKKNLQAGLDSETVRRLLEYASAERKTLQDVTNLCRRGAPLESAQIRPGFFKLHQTRKVIKRILVRRLLAQLGRVSPRLPESESEMTCASCGGVAAKWEGRWLCENGCGGTTNE